MLCKTGRLGFIYKKCLKLGPLIRRHNNFLSNIQINNVVEELFKNKFI